MKYLRSASPEAAINKCAALIESAMDENSPLYLDVAFAALSYGTEDATKNITETVAIENFDSIRNDFVKSGLLGIIESAIDDEDKNVPEGALVASERESRIKLAMDTAIATAVALMDADSYQAAYMNARPEPQTGITVIEPAASVQANSYSMSMESFDSFKFEKFRATAIITNALNAITNSFEDTWFKPILVSPAEQGVDVKIRIPYVFNSQNRNADGTAFALNKREILDAIRDRTILANSGNRVVPWARADGDYDAELVATATIGSRNVTSGGATFPTRPLLFNRDIDLIGISGHPGIAGAANQNEQDTLSPDIYVGTIYISLGDGTNTVVLPFDTSTIAGSLFNPSVEGNTQEQVCNFENIVFLTDQTVSMNATTMDTVAELHTTLGLNAADSYKIALRVLLSGKANPAEGNIRLNAIEVTIDNAWTGEGNDLTAATDTQLTALRAAFSGGNGAVTLVGYEPKATRTNSNLRDRGTTVDMGTTLNYRLAIPMQSPLTSTVPLNVPGGGAGMDGLQLVKRVRNTNVAVQTLLNFRDTIIATNGVKTQHAGIGSSLITPTYVHKEVALEDVIATYTTSNAREDLQTGLVLAIEQVADTLLEDSGYLAVLDAIYGTTTGYEIIVATSPRFHGLIMTSGDARTFGNNKRFKVVSNHDDDFIDKIFISVRRPGENGADPLSFGIHASVPALVYQSPVTVRGGSHSSEVQLVPRELFAPMCPILGEITLTGIDGLFTDSVTQ